MRKCNFSEKVDAVQKYLLWKSRSFLDTFILNSFLRKKKKLELPILKK